MTKRLQLNVIFHAIVLISFSECELIKQCPDYQTHFEKIIGYRPPTVSSLSANYGAPFEQKILFRSYHQIPSVINLQCMELCRNDHNCESYVLNFNKSECYGYTSNDRLLHVHNLRRLDDHELVEDISVVYFVKTCLNSEFHSFHEFPTIASLPRVYANLVIN
jgi:hypothetical protein